MDHHFEPVKFAIFLFVLVYSCILHECAHVWVAWKLGDPTGKNMGRLTLNPLPHIDLFWTLILPAITYLSHKGAIGGPKPAPVNPLNFRNPRSGEMWTALAGPATNLLLAAGGMGVLCLLFRFSPDFVADPIRSAGTNDLIGYDVKWNAVFLTNVMVTNVTLAAFNLIPVPPLDGSRFLQFILGRRSDELFDKIGMLGILPMLLAAYFLAPYAIVPMRTLLWTALGHLASPEFAYALFKAL